jgi:hypothetical protein
VLDDLGGPGGRLLRVEASRSPGVALVEEVVRPVELDLDRVEAFGCLSGESLAVAGLGVEALLLRGEGVDPVEDIEIRHGPSRLVPRPRARLFDRLARRYA